MDEPKRPETFLELPDDVAEGAAIPRGVAAPEGWLELAERAGGDAPEASVAPSAARKKTRVGARQDHSVRDALSLSIVVALPSERPFLSALWPDLSAAELLRSPPPPQALHARVAFARSAIDAVARRDAESRARAQLAQRALDERLARIGEGDEALERALGELRVAQRGELLSFARLLAGAAGAVVATDLARLDAAATDRGVDPELARAWLLDAGIKVEALDAKSWSPLEALPGAPATLDEVALALLRHPAQAAELVRAGTILAWLRANGAAGELAERSREARMVMERGGAAALAVHQQVWALGRRELILGSVWLRSPSELASALRDGHLPREEVVRAARDGLLAAWLRLVGWVAAAGAADLAARGEPSGLRRLAWSLGEPIEVGEERFSDLDGFARALIARPELHAPALALAASGELLAWMESLPPSQRDEVWIDRLRRGRSMPNDPRPLWFGARQRVGRAPLLLRDDSGAQVSVTSVSQLRITSLVSSVWDSLRAAHRSGDLSAWVAVVAPEHERVDEEWPPADEDASLNAALWSLGHTGLVLEWGAGDRGVVAPADLVRAYQSSWQRFEAAVARGFVLDWLQRYHGNTTLVPADAAGPALTLGAAIEGLRGETQRLPAGYAALKLATLCGLRELPVDPTRPGDEATCRGFASASAGRQSEVRDWEPLRGHVLHGTALLWLALQPGTAPALARPLLRAAFSPWNPGADMVEHGARIVAQLARSFGPPVPTATLQRELGGAPPQGAASAKGKARAAGSSSATKVLAILAGLLALIFAALLAATFVDRADGTEPGQPDAQGREARWVRIRVVVRASPTQRGGRWDLDGSPPDLRVRLHARDEVVVAGPCEDSFECERSWERLRLIPGVPFRVRVDDLEGPIANALGAIWMRWDGGEREVLRAKLDDVAIEVSVGADTADRAAPPSAARPASTPAARVAPPARRDAGAAPPRASSPSGRSRSTRTRSRRITPLDLPIGEF